MARITSLLASSILGIPTKNRLFPSPNLGQCENHAKNHVAWALELAFFLSNARKISDVTA